MYKNKRILALIPARSGSKGLPGKNILSFCGKPLLAWSIEQAKKSKFIDTIVVSTDSEKIAGIARKFSAETPFLRPNKISGSSAKTIDAVFHAINFFDGKGCTFDFVMLLQPTSPFRTEQDIDEAIQLLFNKKAKAIISVCKVEHSPLWSATLPKSLSMKEFFNSDISNKNRQSLPDFYRINGVIYFCSINYLRKNRGFLGSGAVAYLMPQERSIDIDTRLDFEFAKFLAGKRKCRK